MQGAGDEVGHVVARQGHARRYDKLLELVVHEHGEELGGGSVGGGMQGNRQHDGEGADAQQRAKVEALAGNLNALEVGLPAETQQGPAADDHEPGDQKGREEQPGQFLVAPLQRPLQKLVGPQRKR